MPYAVVMKLLNWLALAFRAAMNTSRTSERSEHSPGRIAVKGFDGGLRARLCGGRNFTGEHSPGSNNEVKKGVELN